MIPVTFVDIETKPLTDSEIEKRTPAFDVTTVRVGNLRDPQKIQDKRVKAREGYYKSIKNNAALHAETGWMFVLTLWRPGEDEPEISIAESREDEPYLLNKFWGLFRLAENRGGKIVGHNILGFDVPFMIRRSLYLRLAIPTDVFDGRYLNRRVFVDTMQLWACGQYKQFIGLDQLAKCFGLAGKTSTGARVPDMSHTELVEYCKSDIQLTKQVGEEFRWLFDPEVFFDD